MKTLIIAEAGVNHNGDVEIAKKLVDVAVAAKADIVKFQTFKAEALVTKTSEMAEYQKANSGGAKDTQFELLKKLELSIEAHHEIIAYCKQKNITFLSTGFDLESLSFLNEIGLRTFKVPSGEITNYPYLKKLAQFKPERVIVSTGMSRLGEVEDAIAVLEKYGVAREKITILHCNTEYPTPMVDVNLKAMVTMGNALGTSFGYSDHTLGITIPVAAVALGATVIEKHFTLSRTMKGVDHAASLEPQELTAMVQAIRDVEVALGNGIKGPKPSEIKNIPIARKSLVAKQTIKAGEVFTEENLTTKRPGSGMSPMLWESMLGKKAKKTYSADELIQE